MLIEKRVQRPVSEDAVFINSQRHLTFAGKAPASYHAGMLGHRNVQKRRDALVLVEGVGFTLCCDMRRERLIGRFCGTTGKDDSARLCPNQIGHLAASTLDDGPRSPPFTVNGGWVSRALHGRTHRVCRYGSQRGTRVVIEIETVAVHHKEATVFSSAFGCRVLGVTAALTTCVQFP